MAMATLLFRHALYIGQDFITDGKNKPKYRIVCPFPPFPFRVTLMFAAVGNKTFERVHLLQNKSTRLSYASHAKLLLFGIFWGSPKLGAG